MKHKLIVIFPFYPTLQTLLTYDMILGLQCLNWDIYSISLKRTNYAEHSYFKNKCKIFYIEEIINKLSFSDYIIYGIRYLVSSFYMSILFLVYALKNPAPLKKTIAILKFQHNYKLNGSISILAQSYISTSLYGTFLKKVMPQSKLVFTIQSYYGQLLPVNIKQLNLKLNPIHWLIIRYVLKNLDLISSIAPKIHLPIVKIYKRYKIKNSFSFTLHKIPIACSCIVNKPNNSYLKIIFVSHLRKEKAVKEALVEIGPLLQNYNIHINIVGDGEERKDIEEWIRINKLESKITLAGVKDRIKILEMMKEADILIHNSYLEGGPIVLLEALMCMTIPIIRKTGIVEYIIKDGYNGFIIDEQNTLYSILEKILKNPEILLQARSNIAIKYKTNANFGFIIKKIDYSLQNLHIPHPSSKIKLFFKP